MLGPSHSPNKASFLPSYALVDFFPVEIAAHDHRGRSGTGGRRLEGASGAGGTGGTGGTGGGQAGGGQHAAQAICKV